MQPLLWIDLEMTGLDVEKERIIEIAAVVTDYDWNELGSFHRVVFQPQEILAAMDDWCKKTHGASGLTAEIPNGIPLEQAENDLMIFMDRYFRSSDRVVLAGNSVGNDKMFIDRYMPKMSKRLHYRIIDVSSFKEVFRHKYGITVQKGNAHRALDDIHESLKELKTYLSYVKVPVE